MEHVSTCPNPVADVRFAAVLAGLDAVLLERGLSCTVKTVRQALAVRLGLAADALDPWATSIRALTEEALERQQNAAGIVESVAPVPQDVVETVPPKKLCKRQYCGTWSHTEDASKKKPEDMNKNDFGELLLLLLNRLFQNGSSSGKRARHNQVLKVSVWEEMHKNGKKHYHFPMLAEYPWYKEQLQRALQEKGIYVHISGDHDYYWTNFVYVAVPSSVGGKCETDLDQQPWLSPGHPSVRETLEDIPRGARGSDKARVRRYLEGELDDPNGAGSSSSKLAFSDKEFSAFVVGNGFRALTPLLAWVNHRGAQRKELSAEERATTLGVEAYCLRNQTDLQRRVDFAWRIADAPHQIAMQTKTAWEVVLDACERPCLCEGQWIPRTDTLLQWQCEAFPPLMPQHELPASDKVRDAIRSALQRGAQKHTNVFFYGPNTSGKSHVLKPLMEIFAGYVFVRPVGKGNYPLQDIFGAKVCVLQDVRTSTFKLSWDDLLVWFEGEKFVVPFPRNTHSKDMEYHGRAPIFVSTGNKFAISDAEAHTLKVNAMEQNAMMEARFRFFHFPRSLAEHEKKETPTCGRCFAHWICGTSAPSPASSAVLLPVASGTWL